MSRRAWWVGVWNLLGVLLVYFALPVNLDRAAGKLALSVIVSVVGSGVVAALVVLEAKRRLQGAARALNLSTLVLLVELVLVTFAFGYYLLEVRDPSQMVGLATRLDALYFSLTTMTTVGYGDVYAEGQVARALVTFQIAFDVVFLAALARLANDKLRFHRKQLFGDE